MDNSSYECQGCGATVTRPTTRGQRPKWCKGCRAKSARQRICTSCSADFISLSLRKTCPACTEAKERKRRADQAARQAAEARRRRDSGLRFDPRSALTQAFEGGDWPTVLAELENRSTRLGTCWVWSAKTRDGYPVATVSGKSVPAHRLSLHAKMGQPLGSQAAHHICANVACVNPAHLQPVTHRENSAEMLARHSYLARIRELESALADLDPAHHLLAVIEVA